MTKVDVHSAVEQSASENYIDNPLPGSNLSPSAKSTGKVKKLSRANVEENHMAPTFGTIEYSPSLAYGFEFLNN